MAFGSMLGARFKKKKSSYGKGNWELDGNGLGPLDFALGFWQRIPQKFHRWLRVGSSLLGLSNKTTAGISSHQGGTGALTPQCIVAQQGALWYCPWGPHTGHPGPLQCAMGQEKDPFTHVLG